MATFLLLSKRRMDLDGNGRISREEFASVAANIWDEQQQQQERNNNK